MTEYVPAVATGIGAAVSPVLHNTAPVNDPTVNTDWPQLLTTVTVGVDGIAFGADIPVTASLVHPSTV